MKKIQHYSEHEAVSGSIRPEILDCVFEHGGAAAVERVKEIVGGIGGGWDDPSVPQPLNKVRDWLPREKQVFINKITCLIDHCNRAFGGPSLEQAFKSRLPAN